VVIGLGSLELRDAAAGSSLSPDEKRIIASVHATATARAAAGARVFLNQPLTDEQGVGDGETPAAAYPAGPWTVDWSYNCGSTARNPHFKVTLYDAGDFSYQHGQRLVMAQGQSGSGVVREILEKRKSGNFLLDPETNCAWHVRAMSGLRSHAPKIPSGDHV
jgi:hypothetical protein